MNADRLGELLREPAAAARRCHDAGAARELAAMSLVTIAAGGLVFGAAVGAFRGGWQIAAAAGKVPLATLAALMLCAPAFHALAAALGRPWPLGTVVALTLAAGARSSLVLLALAPPLWLAVDLGAGYDLVKLLATLAYGAAGLSALSLLVRGLGPGPGRAATATAFVGVFLLVGGQTAWLLRPYLGYPEHGAIPLLATGAEDGGVFGALVRSTESVLTGRSMRP